MECSFCYAKIPGPFDRNCPNCGFPVQGTAAEQESFVAQHTELKQEIDEAESALSWARFGMLWPGLGAIIGSLFFYSALPGMLKLLAGVISGGILIAAYFLVPRKPVPVLLACVIYILLCIVTLYFEFSFSFSVYLLPLLILLTYGNALYTSRKLARHFKQRQEAPKA